MVSETLRALLSSYARGDGGAPRPAMGAAPGAGSSPSLDAFLLARGVAPSEAVLAWDREIRELSAALPARAGQLFPLSVGDVDWGTQACWQSLTDIHGPGVLSHTTATGEVCILVGRLVWGGSLYLGPTGNLYRKWVDRDWVLLARSPQAYLAKLCTQLDARARGWASFGVPGRASAARLATKLAVSESAELGDDVLPAWRTPELALWGGELDDPVRDVTWLHAAPSAWPAVMRALDALGLGACVATEGMGMEGRTERAALLMAPAWAPDAVSVPLVPLGGQGAGRLVLGETPAGPCLTQMCGVGDWLVSRAHLPRGEVVSFIAQGHFPALSPLGRRAARELGILRDRRRTCGPEVLKRLLDAHRLPHYPAALETEARFGGWCKTLADDGESFSLGTYGVFLRDEETRAPWAATWPTEALENARQWPRVQHEGAPLVPIGTGYREILYVTAGGVVVAHDWDNDVVARVASSPSVLAERRTLRHWLDCSELFSMDASALVGAELGAWLGARPLDGVTDAHGAGWERDGSFVIEDAVKQTTTLFSPDVTVVRRAVEEMASLHPGVQASGCWRTRAAG